MTETAVDRVADATIPGWIAGTWTVDAAHSAVGFSVRHLMGRVRGWFTEFDARIVTTEDPAGSSVTAEVVLGSVGTGVAGRDQHLRSADFFRVDEDPVMRFVSTGLRREGEGWVLVGDLTLCGVSRSVDVVLECLGVDPTGVQGEARVGFSGRTVIRRSDFGVSFGLAVDGGKVVVGDKVEVSLDIEGVLDA